MCFARLLAPVVRQDFVAELLARQVENYIADDVIAVRSAVIGRHAVYLSAENVLRQKGGYGALTERFVVFRPTAAKPRRAGVSAPYIAQPVVKVARTWILRLIFGPDFFERGEDLSYRRLGFWPLLLALTLATLLFMLIYVWADGAGTRPLWFNLVRVLLSTLASTALSLFTVNLFTPERQ